MADDTIKRLEARVTELENRLGQLSQSPEPADFSADDLATYHKVSESLSAGPAGGCVTCGTSCLSECKPCVKPCKSCVVSCLRCIQPCINECVCGPCGFGGGGHFGGGFGGFGL